MIRVLLALALLCCGGMLQAQAVDELHAQDARLAIVAERLMLANAALCRQTMPMTGLVLHSADQYGAEVAETLFPNGPVGIALVLPGSPAEMAGLKAGDGLTTFAHHHMSALAAPEDGYLREAAFEVVASQPANAPIPLMVRREAGTFTNMLIAPPGCRALVEIVTGHGLMGRSDGRVIQLSYRFAQLLDDDGLATIFAHELAHVVLEHRIRLEAAGVKKGLLGEFGRDRQLNRQVEEEADLMSAHILANAGYDPAIAAAFWRSETGRRAGGGLFRSGTYPSPRERADAISAEIAAHIGGATGLSRPDHLLALRDKPFAE